MVKNERKKVLIGVKNDGSQGYLVRQGVLRYGLERGHWRMHICSDTDAELSGYGAPGGGGTAWDGICMLSDLGDAGPSRSLGLPVVYVGDMSRRLSRNAPCVMSNNMMIGQLAAEHFLRRGFQRFGFVGEAGDDHAAERLEGYVQQLSGHGDRVVEHWVVSAAGPASGLDLSNWLRPLPRPLAVLCGNDRLARQVIDAGEAAGLAVPDDVCVLGVGNDLTTCATGRVFLSSIATCAERLGYEAASLLGRLMTGEPLPDQPVRIPPQRVVVRQSTDTVAVDDPTVSRAIRYMREHLAEPITITAVAGSLGVAVRTLESHFSTGLGTSIKAELCRLRVEQAKRLIASSDMSLAWIAVKIGCRDVAHLNRMFRRVEGMSPLQFHERVRVAGRDLTA